MDLVPIEVSCRDVQTRLDQGDDLLLLDCREQTEFDIVSIAGATLIPMSELQARAAELADHQSRDVIVVCHHGGRSQQVATWLRQQGFARAQSMAGGIDRWSLEINPVLPRY